jgi:hypothetical protein
MYHRVEKELVFAGTWFLQKRIPGKVTLKKGIWKGIPFFCRNLEVIPQDSWNWKAKKRNAKRNAQPSLRVLSDIHHHSLARLKHRHVVVCLG